MNIYVGNLSFQTTEENLREAFEGFGNVSSVNIITDKFSGESRGFAFVEMSNNDEATAAIQGLNGADLGGRNIKVSEARPREERGGYQQRGRTHRRGGSRRRY